MPSLFDALENPAAPPAAPAPAGGGSLFDRLENPTPHFVADQLRQNKPWAEVEPRLTEMGVEPEHFRQQYRLEEETRKEMGQRLGTGGIFARGLPVVGGLIHRQDAKDFDEAKKRFDEGKATDDDFKTMARYRHRQELTGIVAENAKPYLGETGGKVAAGLLAAGVQAPAIVGETMLGGGLARGGAALAGRVPGAVGRLAARVTTPAEGLLGRAGQFAGRQAVTTPVMTSLYMKQAAEKNLAEGRDPDDIRGYPPALGLAYANNLVLGSLSRMASPYSAVQAAKEGVRRVAVPAAGRWALAGAAGTVEQAGVDVLAGAVDELLPKAFKTDTKYGVLGMLARGEGGDALAHATVQAVSFAGFAAMHHGPEAGDRFLGGYSRILDAYKDSGLPPDVAARHAGMLLNRLAKVYADRDGKMTAADAKALLQNVTLPGVRDGLNQLIDASSKPGKATKEQLAARLERRRAAAQARQGGTETAPEQPAEQPAEPPTRNVAHDAGTNVPGRPSETPTPAPTTPTTTPTTPPETTAKTATPAPATPTTTPTPGQGGTLAERAKAAADALAAKYGKPAAPAPEPGKPPTAPESPQAAPEAPGGETPAQVAEKPPVNAQEPQAGGETPSAVRRRQLMEKIKAAGETKPAADTTLRDVVEAAGLAGRTNAEKSGEFSHYLDYPADKEGLQTILRWHPEKSAVEVAFEFKNTNAGLIDPAKQRMPAGHAVSLMRDLTRIAGAAKAKGLAVEFRAEPVRAALYARGLEKAGFRLAGEPTPAGAEWMGLKQYRYEPTRAEKPAEPAAAGKPPTLLERLKAKGAAGEGQPVAGAGQKLVGRKGPPEPADADPFTAAGLTAREQTVIVGRRQGRTLEDIGQELGVSREWVRQIERAAQVKLGRAQSVAKEHAEGREGKKADLIEQGHTLDPADPEARTGAKKRLTHYEQAERDLEAFERKLEQELKDAGPAGLSPERQAALVREHEALVARLEGRNPPPEGKAGGVPGGQPEGGGKAPKPAGKVKKPKPTTAEVRAKRLANLKQNREARTLVSVIRKWGGIDKENARRLGMDVQAIEESPAKGVFRDAENRAGTLHVEDIIPELIRSGDLPAESPDRHHHDLLAEKLIGGAKEAESLGGAEGDREMARREAAAFEQEKAEFEQAQGKPGEADESGLKDLPADFDFFDFLKGESGHFWFPGPDLLPKLSHTLFSARGADPNFRPDADPNPDNPRALPPHAVVLRAAHNQVGARTTTPAEIATTAHAWEVHAAEQLSNAWLLAHAAKGDPFEGSTNRSDVIEAEMKNPGSQNLTPEQRAFVGMWKEVLKKQLTAMKANGVKLITDDQGNERTVADLLSEGYFPRPAKPKTALGQAWAALFGEKGGGGGSKLPGVKPSHKKARAYDTEAGGHAAGVKYVRNSFERVAKFIKDSNREIADHRLANDPLLGGKDIVTPYFKRLLMEKKQLLDSLPRAERDEWIKTLKGLATQAATGNVYVAPAFKGKEYAPEVKAHLEAMYGQRGGAILKVATALNQEMRNIVLGADASFATLQLQKMIFTHPWRYLRTMYRGFESFFRPDTLARLVAERPEYQKAVNEFAQAGGSVGTPPEQVSTLGRGRSLVGKIPLLGPAYERAARAFSTVMDLAKIEYWLANRPADPKQWPRAVEAIEYSLGQGRMEQLGMTPERALAERLLLLAPSYYRAHVSLLRQAGQGGAAGALARKQLGHLAGGVLLTGIGALYAMKLAGAITQDEFEERMNPARGKFLTIPVKLGSSGKTAEVGLGGVYMSLVRTLGNTVEWARGRTSENPATKWYRGHAGTLARFGADVVSGRDFQGSPTTPGEAALRSVLPVAAQQATMGTGTPAQRGADVAAGLVGLRSFPGSDAGRRLEGVRKLAAEKGLDWKSLSLPQQARLVRQYEHAQPKPRPLSVEEQRAAKERAAAGETESIKRITKLVSPDTRRKLEALDKILPPAAPTLALGGVEVPMDRARRDRYERLVAEEYDRAVAKWDAEKLKTLAPDRRDKLLRDRLELAKERAKYRLVRESAGK